MGADDTGSTSANDGVKPPSYDPTVNTTENQFWKNYAKEADSYDKDFLLKNGSNIEGVLIFAGLFSAVSASFLVASQANLSPNPADTTNALLTMLVDGNSNSTLLNQSPGVPSSAVLASQILGYLALSASLLAALGAVLGKQWLSEFTQLQSGPLQERGRIRQQKLDGLKRWRFEIFMGALPSLIQLALLLFSFSLILNLWELNRMVAGAVIATTAIGILLYLFVTLASLLSPTCPYRTPVSSTIQAFVKCALKSVGDIAYQWSWELGARRSKRPSISRTNKILANVAVVSFSLFFIATFPILVVMLAILGLIFVCVTWIRGGRGLLQREMDSYRPYLQLKKLRLQLHKSLLSISNSARNTLDFMRRGSLDPGPGSNSRSIAWLLETSTDPDSLMAAAELVPDTEWPKDLDISLPTEHLCSMFIRSIVEEDPESLDKRASRLGKASVIMLSRAPDKISARFGRPALERITALIDSNVDHDLHLIATIVVKLLSSSIRRESPMEFPTTLEVSQSLLGWLLQPLESLLRKDKSLRSSFLPEAEQVFFRLKWPEDSKLQGIDEEQYCQTFEAYFNIVMSGIEQTDETTDQSLEDKTPVERLKSILERLKKLDLARFPTAHPHLIVPFTVLSKLTSISRFKQAINDAAVESWILTAFKEAVSRADKSGGGMWPFVSRLVQLATDVDAFNSIEGQAEKCGVGSGKTPSPPLRIDSTSLLSYLLNKESPATPKHVTYALRIMHNNVDEHSTLASNPHFVNYILRTTDREQEYSIRDIGLKVLVATCQSLLYARDAASLARLTAECSLDRFLQRAIHHQETTLQSILEIDDEVFKEKLLGILALGNPFNALLTKLRDEPNNIPERDLRDLEIALVLSNGDGRRKLLFDHLDQHISGQIPLWDTMALPLTVIVGWLLRRDGPVNSAEGIVKEVLRPNFESLLVPAWGDPVVLEDNPQMLRLLLESTTRWLPTYVNSGTGKLSQSETILARLQVAVDQLRSGNRALSVDIKRALQRLHGEISRHSAETRV